MFRNRDKISHPDYINKAYPPNGHVSLWIEVAKLPAEVVTAGSVAK